MKRSITLTIFVALTLLAIAIPPSPYVLQELEQQGDTTTIRLMWQHFDAIQQRRQQVRPHRVAAQQDFNNDMDVFAIPRGVVILVSFDDILFSTPSSRVDSMFNSDNYTRTYVTRVGSTRTTTINAKGSVAQYFRDNSMGAYNPQFDVFGPYRLSHDMAYYGENDAAGNDKHADEMVKEAVMLADADADFSQYDADGDGQVDFVLIYYAGYGEASGGGANTIWPHSYFLADGYHTYVTLDGKRINAYACFNELNKNSMLLDGIGTCVHEFSHVIGLPDLYPTGGQKHKTLGAWDVLDYGPYNNDGNTPPCYSAYERFVMGWLRPIVINSPLTPHLEELQTSNKAFMITSSGISNLRGTNPDPATFYLLENRQKSGWDQYLPGAGLLITRVNYNSTKWQNNTVNNTANSMGVDIMEADGNAPANSTGKAGDAFPRGATFYTPQFAQYPITNIVLENKVITFDFMGGGNDALEDIFISDTDYSRITDVFDVSGRHLLYVTDAEQDLPTLRPGLYLGRTTSGTTTKFYKK